MNTSCTPAPIIARGLIDQAASFDMDKKKLQKLLYYVQGWSLAALHTPAHVDQTEAWRDGPVVPSVRNAFWGQSCQSVRISTSTDQLSTIPSEVNGVISLVVAHYGSLSTDELIDMTHEEKPWANARQGLNLHERSRIPISLNDLHDYFANSGQRLMGLSVDELRIIGLQAFDPYRDESLLPEPIEYKDVEHFDTLDQSANLFHVA